MRKIIIIVMIMVVSFGFSQERSKQKTTFLENSRFDVSASWNKIQFRLDKSFSWMKYPIRTELSFRYNRAEAFTGVSFLFDENIFFTTQVGLRYLYDENVWDPLLKASLRGKFRWGLIRINYGSQWVEYHGISSSVMINFIGPFLRFGIASHNEYIGPRMELNFKLGKNKRSIRFHTAYFPKEQRFDYGLRLRFGEWFPKIGEKIKKIEKDINPFLKKSE